jgi:hypothetical protein
LRARLTVLGERSPARVEPERRWPASEHRARVDGPLVCVVSSVPEQGVAFASRLLAALADQTDGVVALVVAESGGILAGVVPALRAAGAEQVALLNETELGSGLQLALPPAASGPARVGVGLGWTLAAGVVPTLCVYVESRPALDPRERAWAATLRANADLQVAAPGDAVAALLGEWLGARVAARAAAERGAG